MNNMAAMKDVAIQKQIQLDWSNREYVEIITGSIKKISDFLNSFDASCRGKNSYCFSNASVL